MDILHFHWLYHYNNDKDILNTGKKMNQDKEQQILFANLVKMVESPESYFDEGIARYTLSRLGANILKNHVLKIYKSSNFYFKGNLWAMINAHCHEAHFASFFLAQEEKQPKKNEDKIQRILNTQNRLENWKILLNEINPALTPLPQVSATLDDYFMNNSYDISLHGFLAIKNTPAWYELKNQIPLSVQEERLMLIDVLRPYQDMTISTTNIELVNYIVDRLIEQKPEILHTFNADDAFILKSKMVKLFMKEIAPEKSAMLIEKIDIKELYKKSQKPEALISNPDMLINAMNVATPEQWLDTFRVGKHFKLLSFFNAKFNRSYGISLVSDSTKKMKQRYYAPRPALYKELEYLSSALKKETLPDKVRMTWYSKVMEHAEKDLFLLSLKCINLPDKDNTPEKIKFYDGLMNQTVSANDSDSKDFNTWKYYLTQHLAEDLTEKLEAEYGQVEEVDEKNMNTHLKLKI